MSQKKNESSEKAPAATPKDQEDLRDGRKFAVSSNRGKAKGKVRYIETNDPSKGCRFL